MSLPDETGIGELPLPRCEQLAAADGTSLAGRFHVWKGRSGRRYVVSAYSPDAVPDYEDAVVMAVARRPDGPRLLACTAREGCGADVPFTRKQDGLIEADEIHLHLLARDAASRAAVVADLAHPQGA